MIRLQIESDAKDDALDVVKTAIAAEIKRREIGLQRTEQHITAHEHRYGISSDVFERDYAAEDLEGRDREYVEWAGELEMRERIAADLNKLKTIEYVAQ